MKYQRNIYVLLITVLFLLYLILISNSVDAKITGSCANCHTMHASQNGSSGDIAYGGSSLPQPALLRGDCLGCHGMGPTKIVTINGSDFPQVLHTDTTDLAGGNFAYITGAKPRVTADKNSAGHNVIDLGAGYKESVLPYAPGFFIMVHDFVLTKDYITCAGYVGCHGKRIDDGHETRGIEMIKGAHHNNVDGICNSTPVNADIYNSYRFLVGVKGLENTGPYKWQNYNANNHNEYFGQTAPLELGCSATSCHGNTPTGGGVYSPNGSISAFCGTCHGQFHDKSEMGGGSSPFKRHPTDVFLPASGEYLSYTAYSTQAPVARTTVQTSMRSDVVPGTDVVMCLSCHAAHATPYADILRWDYSTMVAGGGGSGGCFTCHTEKNQAP
jgi:hypothetical protein